MDSVLIECYPKVNLRLSVGRPRADGYHPVRSLMVELRGISDTIEIAHSDRRQVICPGVPERQNLAWRALDLLQSRSGRPLPVAVRITKRIPSEAGLGGGSSDAAAVLVGTDRLFNLGMGPAMLQSIGAAVGSDVPFFIRGGAQWATGRGERLTPTEMPPFAGVLVRPPFGLSTGRVYKQFDRMNPGPFDSRPDTPPPMPELADWVRNDLWPAALALAPHLGDHARALHAAGARSALLCGSGSCLLGLATDRTEAEQIAARLGDDALAVVEGGGPAAPR